jgi:hypothetical protein
LFGTVREEGGSGFHGTVLLKIIVVIGTRMARMGRLWYWTGAVVLTVAALGKGTGIRRILRDCSRGTTVVHANRMPASPKESRGEYAPHRLFGEPLDVFHRDMIVVCPRNIFIMLHPIIIQYISVSSMNLISIFVRS